MERRTKLLIVILVAAIVLAFGIWYLVQPLLRTVPQPAPLPGQVTPQGTGTTPKPTPSTGGTTVVTTPTAQSPRLKQLEDLAGIFVARLGSGASGDGFRGYTDVLINATQTYQQQLLAEQAALQKAHPARGPVYGLVTRVVAINNQRAVEGDVNIPFVVQVQQVEDAGNPSMPTRTLYKEATVTFERQADKTYLVSSVVWKDIAR